MDVDPVKAFQDDMKLEDEGYTGNNIILISSVPAHNISNFNKIASVL